MNIEKFLSVQSSETTVKQYASVLRLYETYCKETAFPWDSQDTIHSYLGYLRRCKVALNTIKNRIACIRSFFLWHKLEVHEFPVVRGDDSIPTDGLSDDEARRIIECIDLNDRYGAMHSALIHLMLFTGIRCGEARNIKLGMIREIDGMKVLSVIGKGNKIRQLPLQECVSEKISEWVKSLARIDMREAEGKSEGLFLFSQDGGKTPIHQQTIRNIILRLVKKAGITKSISPHSLRVTAISNVIAQNCPLPVVMEMGGWNSMEMVLRYDRRSKLLKNAGSLRVNYGNKK